MKRVFKSAIFLIGLVAVVCFVCPHTAHSAIDAAVTINEQNAGGGVYNYTLTLTNFPTSTSSIETLWFSWIPGLDFMSASPITTTAPSGWGIYVESGYYGGYSIQYTTTTTPLNPNGSLHFGFTSTVTPTELAGNDSVYGYYPELTTYLYSMSVEGGASESLLAQPIQSVPEPSTFALAAFGIAGAALGVCGRRLRFWTSKQSK